MARRVRINPPELLQNHPASTCTQACRRRPQVCITTPAKLDCFPTAGTNTRCPRHEDRNRRPPPAHHRHRPPPLQGGRPFPGRMGPRRDPPGRARDARAHGDPPRIPRQPPARRRPHHGLAPHDRADGRAHRDAGRTRRLGPLGVVQHLLHAGSRRGSRGGRPGRQSPTIRKGPPSSRGRARPWRNTGGAPSRRSPGRAASAPR